MTDNADIVKEVVQACLDIAGKDGLKQAEKWTTAYQGGNMWAAYDCYLTAMRDVIGLKLPSHEPYKFWEESAIHGSFRIMHEDFCLVSDFPDTLKVDDENRPHCQDGPSHRWRDGWSLYHWHGVRIPDEWIENPASLTASVALAQTNLEVRRAGCEMLGWAKILDQLNAKSLDKDADPEIGELLEVELPGLDENDDGEEQGPVMAKFLRVRCGTGRDFAICVDPSCNTAIEAQAWMLGIDDTKWFKPEVRT